MLKKMFGKKRLAKMGIGFAAVLLVVAAAPVFAQEVTDTIITQIDTMWLFIGSFLVFFMQAGFAMVESGFTRSKNSANLIMKNLLDFSAGALVFFCVGFAFMYGDSAGGFIGTSNFFLSSDRESN